MYIIIHNIEGSGAPAPAPRPVQLAVQLASQAGYASAEAGSLHAWPGVGRRESPPAVIVAGSTHDLAPRSRLPSGFLGGARRAARGGRAGAAQRAGRMRVHRPGRVRGPRQRAAALGQAGARRSPRFAFRPRCTRGLLWRAVAFGPAGALRPPFHTLLACCRAAARALTAPQPQRGPRPRRVRAGATATGRHALSSARLGTAVLPASHWRMCLPG